MLSVPKFFVCCENYTAKPSFVYFTEENPSLIRYINATDFSSQFNTGGD